MSFSRSLIHSMWQRGGYCGHPVNSLITQSSFIHSLTSSPTFFIILSSFFLSLSLSPYLLHFLLLIFCHTVTQYFAAHPWPLSKAYYLLTLSWVWGCNNICVTSDISNELMCTNLSANPKPHALLLQFIHSFCRLLCYLILYITCNYPLFIHPLCATVSSCVILTVKVCSIQMISI